MANTLRIRRRVTGLAGAPSSLASAELAYNEVDDTLYYGKGLGSGIDAATVIPIAGPGLMDSTYVSLTAAQTISGAKTFTNILVPTAGGADNSTKAASTAWVRGYAQPLSASLSAVAALAGTGVLVQTGASTFANRTITGSARISVANGSGVGGNPTLDLTTTGVTANAYSKVTVDVYGRVTAGAPLSSGDVTSALGYTPENAAQKGVANGYASLDASGLVPTSQLPASVTGGMNYQGTWNASTNTPTIVNGTGNKGDYRKVSAAGSTTIDGNSNWTLGDLIVFNGTTWDKIEGGSPDVVSVAGRVGAIVLTAADIGGLGSMATQNSGAVTITGGSIAASTITGNITGNAVNVTGTVAVGNGGTGAVTLTGYVKGNGTSVMTASASIPNTDISGLGTMSVQNASAVNITGGVIDGITIDGGTF